MISYIVTKKEEGVAHLCWIVEGHLLSPRDTEDMQESFPRAVWHLSLHPAGTDYQTDRGCNRPRPRGLRATEEHDIQVGVGPDLTTRPNISTEGEGSSAMMKVAYFLSLGFDLSVGELYFALGFAIQDYPLSCSTACSLAPRCSSC